MNSRGLPTSPFATAIASLSICFGLTRSPVRRATPPPIFLLPRHQDFGTRLALASPVIPVETLRAPLSAAPRALTHQSVSMLQAVENMPGLLSKALRWIQNRRKGGPRSNGLRLAESLSLGEKRFIAVIQFQGCQFLVGGGATNVALLAQVGAGEAFHGALRGAIATGENRKQVSDTESMTELS